MLIRIFVAASFFLTSVAWAEGTAGRENLLGNWQVSEGDTHETWSLESKGDVLEVARIESGKVTLEVKCKPDGKDCNGTDQGQKVTMILYFNGSSLVQMETKDSYVTTRKFTLDGESDRMIIEVNPVTGPGKHHTLRLTRRREAAAR